MPKTTLQAIAGLAILLAWVTALTAGIVTHDYEGLQLVTPVILVFAGYLFGDSIFRRKNGS